MGIDLPVPEHSTVSRRKGKLEVVLPVMPKQGKVHVVVDSTGVKVYGEGEWKTRQHGVSKRRTWRKLHLIPVMKIFERFASKDVSSGRKTQMYL